MANDNHLAQLRQFKEILKKEGFESQVLDVTEQRPYETLLVALPMEGRPEGSLHMEFSFLPDMEAQLDGLSLLQCFVAIAAIDMDNTDMRTAILNINKFCPLVAFGVLNNPHIIYFRHTMMLHADWQQNTTLITQTTWLISYLLEMFGPGLTQLATGSSKITDAFNGHQFEHLILGDPKGF
ncbi:hypothetical protein ACFGVR_19175 [Mucilaginibacter sp. AW1-3]